MAYGALTCMALQVTTLPRPLFDLDITVAESKF
jgi:hypothetical protein